MNTQQPTRRGFLILLGAGGLGGAAWLIARGLRGMTAPASTTGAPPIVAREDWGALPPDLNARNENGTYSLENPEGWRVYTGDLRAIYRTVVIHHSATYGRDDLHTLDYIQNLHREDRGWADIAYHYLIGKGGIIYAGRPLEVRGAHVGGHNTGSVGVCLMGDYRVFPPPEAQIEAAQVLVNWLADHLALTHLAGHTEFNPQTNCPGATIVTQLDAIAAAAGLIHGTDGYQPSEEQIVMTATAAAQTTPPLDLSGEQE
jgi:hypothetical protein